MVINNFSLQLYDFVNIYFTVNDTYNVLKINTSSFYSAALREYNIIFNISWLKQFDPNVKQLQNDFQWI